MFIYPVIDLIHSMGNCLYSSREGLLEHNGSQSIRNLFANYSVVYFPCRLMDAIKELISGNILIAGNAHRRRHIVGYNFLISAHHIHNTPSRSSPPLPFINVAVSHLLVSASLVSDDNSYHVSS